MKALYYVFIMQHQRDLQLQGHGARMQNFKEEQDCKWDMEKQEMQYFFWQRSLFFK